MRRFACWRADDSFAIINPDADALEDYVFRAVHTDLPVQKSSGRARSARTITGEQLLAEVLGPTDHVIVPVIGQSGTGKSHLIRWLGLQLRRLSTNREVIYVPKAQTNLRDIVYLLVKRLPLSEQDPYLSALDTAGSAVLTTEAQKTAILNNLHLALVNDRGGSQSGIDADLEDYALSGLRVMFTDPHIRLWLLERGGFADELAAHVFQKPDNYRPAEERREFREKDLPLRVGHLQRAAQETQEFLRWLIGASEDDRRTVVSIVNRHVDWAIGNCLNLSGDRLIKLMLDLRKHLGSRELVLLIEDFARLQGLDRALLQSIIEQRPGLCVLRTIFASTVGFYESIEATIKTRITFVVDMDAPGAVSEDKLESFVAHYMNALRWGIPELQRQWGEVQQGHSDFAVPSKCEGCEHKRTCHSTFGTYGGIGLYPFTKQAILTMAERADPHFRKAFNPREFLKLVLRPVARSAGDLETGHFPSVQLLTDLGGKQMPPAQQLRLRRDDPLQWERRETLIELWAGRHDVVNLSTELHAAFDLPMLQGADADPSGGVIAEVPAEPGTREPSLGSVASPAEGRVRELQEWQEGRTVLQANTAQMLRDLVFAALDDFIDWDSVGTARAPFFAATGAFKKGQISFLRQATQPPSTGIRLQIPSTWEDEAERMRTTMALQGLLESRERGDWHFPHSLEKLACLEESLRVWSARVLDQCREYDELAGAADLPTTAFESRVVLQAALNPAFALTTVPELLSCAFAPVPDGEPDFLVRELSELSDAMRRVDDKLLEVIRTRYSATKGGSTGGFIDAARLVPKAKSLIKRRLVPQSATSGTARDLVDPVRKLAARLSAEFAGCVAKEASARAALAQRLTEALGNRPTRQKALENLQQIADFAGDLGMQGGVQLLGLKPHLETIRVEEVYAALRLADPAQPDIRKLKSGTGNAGKLLDDFIAQASALIARIGTELTGRLTIAGVEPGERSRLVQQIAADLDALTGRLSG